MRLWQDALQGLRRMLEGLPQVSEGNLTYKYNLLDARARGHLLPTWTSSPRRRYVLLLLTILATTGYFISLAGPSREEITFGRTADRPLDLQAYSSSGPAHPVSQLVGISNRNFDSRNATQSKTLADAVQEYRRRYGMPPPPLFDKWYEFAVAEGTPLMDEFDTIDDSLALFWAVSPGSLRKRTLDALGHGNSLMGISIRGGLVSVHGEGQGDFQASATADMISSFATWLPDMDLAFNVNDEPRIVITHEDSDRMLSLARAAKQMVRPRMNNFTFTPGAPVEQGYPPVPSTAFNDLDHQMTWSYAKLACGPDTPARSLNDNAPDAETMFSFQGLDFVHDTVLSSDICLKPSLHNAIGLFNHPNAFSVTHDLIPIFSPSKLSTFGDILYPSSYYYAEKTKYNLDSGVNWDDKIPKLYWRGATSGGFSENGIWKSLLRQSILQNLKSPKNACLLSKDPAGVAENPWTAAEVNAAELPNRYDTEFSEIKQCDFTDCLAQYEALGYHALEPQTNAWKNRYLLDMDGNALSGRFYALLESQSLPMKVAFFREWHADRIFPWKHFVPLSSSTNEYAEVLRYFEEEEEGKQIARELAAEGRDWAMKALRKRDMEVYMFRLLLEYARLIDDNRSEIGYR